MQSKKSILEPTMEWHSAYAPRIYFLHPLLIGPLRAWNAHLDRAAELGFDHALIASPFLPGNDGDVRIVRDHRKPHPVFDSSDSATDVLRALADAARKRGLRLLLDVVVDRLAADSPLYLQHPEWFHPFEAASARLDPRHVPRAANAVRMNFDNASTAEPAIEWWSQQLLEWADAGVAGFRFDAPHRVSAPVWRRLRTAVHPRHPQAKFLAWTIAIARQDVARLADAGFDSVFSSLRWWDYRSSWLFEEHAVLTRAGAPIAFPESPFGPRLIHDFDAGWDSNTDTALIERAYKRALHASVALGAGWLMPMGFEYGLHDALSPHDGSPRAYRDACEARRFDLSAEVVRANALQKGTPALATVGELRALSGPDSPVTALLRSTHPDLRVAEEAVLMVVNPSLHRPARLAPERVLDGVPGEFTRWRPLKTAERSALDATPHALPRLPLAAGDLRLFDALRPAPIRSTPPLARRGAKAAEKKNLLNAIAAPRVIIEAVQPSVDNGRFVAKRVVGEMVEVSADVFAEGHDKIAAAVIYRPADVNAAIQGAVSGNVAIGAACTDSASTSGATIGNAATGSGNNSGDGNGSAATATVAATAAAKPAIRSAATGATGSTGTTAATASTTTATTQPAARNIATDTPAIVPAASRNGANTDWQEVPMRHLGNDLWSARFPLERLGRYEFTVIAWRDDWASLVDHIEKKHNAGQNVDLELEEARALLAQIADATDQVDTEANHALADEAKSLARQFERASSAAKLELVLSRATRSAVAATQYRPFLSRYAQTFTIDAERSAARYASWYEIFPRSMSDDANRHGTFIDVIGKMARVREMGFDVLYFPPIHPIGNKNRKGRNNTLTPAADDVGSPYAIGGEAGGHDALHPQLGSFDDFKCMLDAAHEHGLEIALDFAIQCSPDHPWLTEHPAWFAWRPDGTLRYAENPPKKYQDIVNPDFYADEAKPALWLALRDIILFWIAAGVKIFRVDNPHTKPLPFWEWMIGDIRGRDPDVIFLSEAFTRPKLMYRLAKLGFSQSYTYFTWRESKQDFIDYLSELTQTPPKDFFRPHFFVNTPDINPYHLQVSGRPGFLIRAALASMLSGLWGMYSGFELCEATPLPRPDLPGGRSEEYLDSEKYQLRAWDWDRPGNIVGEITALNRIRRANPALHTHLNVTFLPAHNDSILFFEKATPARDNVVLVAINLDAHHAQSADLELPWRTLDHWRVADWDALAVEDQMTGERFEWRGRRQHVRLDPHAQPFAIWRIAPANGLPLDEESTE
jgi:glycosidase